MSARSLCRQRLHILGQHVDHLFERKAEFVRIDELSDQRDVLARKAVIQPDEEAAQFASDLLVVGAIHTRDRLRPNVRICRTWDVDYLGPRIIRRA
jgi:hypothetical protein